MFKTKEKLMPIFPLALIVVALLVGVIGPRRFNGGCYNTVVEELPSPVNNYKCVVFTRDCGATTGASTQISLLPKGESLDNEIGNIFIADTGQGKAPAGPGGGPAVRISWDDEYTLAVTYHAAARVFKAEGNYKGIRVKYRRKK